MSIMHRIRVAIARVLVPELPVGEVDRLVALYRILPDGERRILDHIATRMHDVGLASYGPVDIERDKRDMAEEERQELYDACVYRALGNLRGSSQAILDNSSGSATPNNSTRDAQ